MASADLKFDDTIFFCSVLNLNNKNVNTLIARELSELMFLPHFDIFCDLLLNQTLGNIESISFI